MNEHTSAVLTFAFRASGKRRLDADEFVQLLSFGGLHIPPTLVRRCVRHAIRQGLLARVGADDYAPAFDVDTVRLGLGFRPDLERLADESGSDHDGDSDRSMALFRRIVRRIAESTGDSDLQVVAGVNREQAGAGDLWTAEAAALVYGHRQGVPLAEFVGEARSGLRLRSKGT